ncbi:MAG TPA: folylpolyglutamate synthase/dihydrofolate synthase family protein [Ferruginibacter sp.]|jgi:dihydrofolate synthase/folylpolyglutamate synthase|nr:folylpolyglutamate synthase/dihydrofolate synthase family protein [Ferruginibacter sp.]
MTYEETLDYLYAQLPMFSKIGAAAYKTDLHNTIALCKALNDPHTKFKSIHVAGTNGKGSTSHMLAAILQEAGYKTGLYTSPHLQDFRERIKINGEMVRQDFIIDFVARTKTISEAIEPSFFELTMVMAFDYFAQEKVDVAIIETGLGGRLDSTNIITPVISVITNIGYDHMNILGDTLEQIAFEKAGIIKKNVPVVIGEYTDITRPIFLAKAKECNAPIYFAQDEYAVSNIQLDKKELHCDVTSTKENITESFTLDLNGFYQIKNLCAVLLTEGILMKNGFGINSAVEKYALSHVKELTGLYGRWDVIHEQPTIALDVAHNEDGIKQVLTQISKYTISTTKVHFIIGMVRDKEIDKVLTLLPKGAHYYFSNAHIPRALNANELKDKAAEYNLIGNSFDDVNEAIQSAKEKATNDELIIVCGSVFLVGEVDRQIKL